MMDTISTVAMWAGSIIFLLAFSLNAFGVLDARRHLSYHLMNAIGAVALGTHFWIGRELPLIVLEGVWGLVAAAAFFRTARSRSSSPVPQIRKF